MVNNICLICRQKNSPGMNSRLGMIETRLRYMEASTDRLPDSRILFSEVAPERCKYGMPCSTLQRADEANRQIIRRIREKTAAVAVNGSDKDFHELLGLCRGYLPRTYRELEVMRSRVKPLQDNA